MIYVKNLKRCHASNSKPNIAYVTAILQDRKPLVDAVMALNLTVSGIVAHQSAMKNGELMKIPQYKI